MDRSHWRLERSTRLPWRPPGGERRERRVSPRVRVVSPCLRRSARIPGAPRLWNMPASGAEAGVLGESRTWAAGLAGQLALRSSQWSPGPTVSLAGWLLSCSFPLSFLNVRT